MSQLLETRVRVEEFRNALYQLTNDELSDCLLQHPVETERLRRALPEETAKKRQPKHPVYRDR